MRNKNTTPTGRLLLGFAILLIIGITVLFILIHLNGQGNACFYDLVKCGL